MKYPRYPKYKDSGVEWLGEVPEGWETIPLRRLCVLNPSRTENSLPHQLPVSFLPMEAVSEDGKICPQEKLLGEVYSGYTYFLENDLLVAKITPCFENGKGAVAKNLSNGIGFGSTEFHVIRPGEKLSAQFIFYVSITSIFRQCGKAEMIGAAGQKRVPEQFVKKFCLSLPQLFEQQTIAAFLDHNCAKIDTLIAEQEKLIALLKEKRQAIISHAVTKGLTPNASMKDSGVEWLGEIPEGWKILPLKRDIAFLTSGSRGWAENYSDCGAIFLRIGNLTRSNTGLDLSDIQRVSVPPSAEGLRTRVTEDDLLFSITAYLGSVAVVPSNFEEAYVNQHIALVRLNKQIFISKWVAFYTLSYAGKAYLDEQSYGGTKVQLSLDDIADMPIIVPTLSEQQTIVDYLDAETAKIDALIAESERAMALLKERRSALISAAVTGKIDVRNIPLQEAV